MRSVGSCLLLLVGRQHGFIQVGSEQYLIEPVQGHSEDNRHPHLVYRRSALQQQQQQQPGVSNDHVSLCGLEDGGDSAVLLGRPFVKRLALPYWTVFLSVCDVGVLWSNGWINQNDTWHGRRPRPRPHCVRWGPSSPFPQERGHSPPFSAHVYCGQTVAHLSYC